MRTRRPRPAPVSRSAFAGFRYSYLVARCQQDASLTQVAGELHTTIDVIRRVIDESGIQRSSSKVRSARQRRCATDQHLA